MVRYSLVMIFGTFTYQKCKKTNKPKTKYRQIYLSKGGDAEYDWEAIKELSWFEDKFEFIPLDSSGPRLFGIKDVMFAKVPSCFSPVGVTILTTIRRFLFILFASINAVLLMGILDRLIFYEVSNCFLWQYLVSIQNGNVQKQR